MLRRRPPIMWFVLCSVLFPLLTASLFAQEFSADFVISGRERANDGPKKIFVGKDKMRIESKDAGDSSGFGMGAFIIDFANHKTLILMPQQKMYMESMPKIVQQRQNMWFRPDDPNNACPQFESMFNKENPRDKVTCRKIGRDTVNGRPAIKYQGTSKNGTGYVWIDSRLRFVVKWQDDKGGSGELRNIKEGPQDASLFQVPPGYHKFDMQQMMRQRQQPPQ